MAQAILLVTLATVSVGAGALGAQEPHDLLEAARVADWAAVETLLREGADPNAAAPDGATALHWAAYHDAREAARILLEEGADPNAANDLEATPLWNASMNGSAPMARILLEGGADPNAALLGGKAYS